MMAECDFGCDCRLADGGWARFDVMKDGSVVIGRGDGSTGFTGEPIVLNGPDGLMQLRSIVAQLDLRARSRGKTAA